MQAYEIFKGAFVTADQCLYLHDRGELALADLHVGYESALESNGIHIPRIQTKTIIESLNIMLDRYEPSKVIIVGDLKHEFSRNLGQEFNDVRKVLELLIDRTEVVLVKGNHDNYLESIASRLDIPVFDSYVSSGLTFAHGHHQCMDRPLVIGHEHPSIKISDTVGAFLKLPCFVHLKEEKVLVLPAFSPLANGTDITDIPASDYLSPVLHGLDISDADIYACSEIGILPLGKLSEVRNIYL